jgi:NodT family efflux transporter outer membrane factor (OMF) lipoprotein
MAVPVFDLRAGGRRFSVFTQSRISTYSEAGPGLNGCTHTSGQLDTKLRSFLALTVSMVAGLALLSLFACTPALGPLTQPTSPSSLASVRSLVAPPSDWPQEAWWTLYGDPQLDALEDEALKSAPTLRVAEARVRKAQALAQEAGAVLQPQLSGDASVQGLRQTLNQGFRDDAKSLLPRGMHDQVRIAANLSYQLDFFGKNRAALAAATSDAKAASVEAAEARLQLSTAVATCYAELAHLFARRDAASDAIRVRKNTFALVAERRANGLAARAEYSQKEALVAVADGELEAIDRQIDITRHQLAALVGAGPDRGLAIEQPKVENLKPMGLPTSLKLDLVGRRPDLVAALLRTDAAAGRIQAARLDYYPNVDLTAYVGVQSLGLSTLFKRGSAIAAFGPALHLPIFDGGRLEGAYRGARADYDEAVARYDDILNDALRDIADVLSSQRSLDRQLVYARTSLSAAMDAHQAMKTRYSAGLTGLIDVLAAENTVIAQRRAFADLRAQFLSLDISLVRALGGGFAAETHIAHAN